MALLVRIYAALHQLREKNLLIAREIEKSVVYMHAGNSRSLTLVLLLWFYISVR